MQLPTSSLRRHIGLAAIACAAALIAGCSATAPSPQAAAASPRPRGSAPAASGIPAAGTAPAIAAGPARCETGQLTAAFTGLSSGMLTKDVTLVLTNHSEQTCYVYGYEGLGFVDSGGHALPTDLARLSYRHANVTLRPGASAYASLQWSVMTSTSRSFASPSAVEITPPDEYTHLIQRWTSGPVPGGAVNTTPFSAARPPVTVPAACSQAVFLPVVQAAVDSGKQLQIVRDEILGCHGGYAEIRGYPSNSFCVPGKGACFDPVLVLLQQQDAGWQILSDGSMICAHDTPAGLDHACSVLGFLGHSY
jgi:Protein of unknown function (DUF4232)